MRNFNITVNGTTYAVGVEETQGGTPVAATPAPVAAAPAPAAAAPAPAAAAPAGEGTKITAPMPGNILDVKVAVGDTVSEGQAIIVLEAMKMENDVVASCAGKITSITVKKGDAVESNQVLATIA